MTLGYTAQAGNDNVYLGTGRDNAITVSTTGMMVNAYAPVTAPAAPGDISLTIGTAVNGSIAAGDLIMVWQATGIIPEPPSGGPGPVDITNDPVGRWEFARVASVAGSNVNLTEPLLYSYAATVTQVVRVPEYTTVTINATRNIVAYPWDGQVGGIVAFLATGTVTNNSSPGVNATGRGFRGGQYVLDMSGATGSTGLDEPAATGAQKGEGIARTRYGSTQTGRGNVANGGGGGVALSAGGGGGGNGGAGGRGGNSDLSLDGNRAVGGLGGTALTFSAANRLVMGGGGGAGHGDAGTGAAGGKGGGVVFIRANALTGPGSITANGATGGSASSDAGSGGGGGGTIYLRIAGAAACGLLQAIGGTGGSVNVASEMGPGGGGGGGRILFQKGSGTCTPTGTSVIGASPGVQQNASAPGGSNYSATSGTNGSTTTLTGGLPQLTATIATPANGSTNVLYRPTFTGTAMANTPVTLIIDGTTTYNVTSDAGGNYSYQLTQAQGLTNGAHTVKVYSSNAAQQVYSATAQSSFTVSTALPVQLISFRATAQKKQVALQWETASEAQSDRYIVERSTDGQAFTAIATIPAAGNSEVLRSYNTLDAAPHNGMNLYRLKMMEKDGSSSYSTIATVNMSAGASVTVAPNPMHDRTTVAIGATSTEAAVFSLYSLDGKVIRTYTLSLQDGTTVLELQRENLPQGFYIYRLRTANGRELMTGKLGVE